MKIRPINGNILVAREEGPKRTNGGLIIPESAKEKPQKGKVIAVGTGRRDGKGNCIPPRVKAGDKILFSKYAGTEIKIENVEHVFMKEDDILGIVS